MFEEFNLDTADPDATAPAVLLLQRVCSAARAQACAAAAQLVAIGEFVALAVAEDGGDSDDWAFDAVDAATIDLAAALGIGRGLAASQVRYAHALRHQLPRLGRAFIVGDVDEHVFRACVFRTGLIIDDDVLARVDAVLAARVPRWGVVNRSQLAARIDTIVARLDADAVRRRRDRLAGREVVVDAVDNGLAEIHATVFAPDGFAFSARLTALAATVCEDDPRSIAERRADAVGVLAAGGDRLGCRCKLTDCPAGGSAAGAVVIHVIAPRATVEGLGSTAAAMLGYEGLIPGELIAELAGDATLRPLVHPGDVASEPGYRPSRALADFVRCRDATCRFPGCDRPAIESDIDHTIPHPGGPTQAGNLKCLCRFHHLAKTFWGWRDEQLRDGTVIWTSPIGEKYVTHPGCRDVFPELCVATAPITVEPREEGGEGDTVGDKSVMMPRRRLTREKQRAADIVAERHRNHKARTSPTPRFRSDENHEHDDAITQEPIPPPF